jgi:hypothetical protein
LPGLKKGGEELVLFHMMHKRTHTTTFFAIPDYTNKYFGVT